MARYDKYDPIGGGFRAALAAIWAAADDVPIGVGLDATGKVVPGAGQTGVIGVCILVGFHKAAGDIVDIMKFGEIVELTGTPAVAGTVATALTTTGVIGVTPADATHVRVGHTVEASRLIVAMP